MTKEILINPINNCIKEKNDKKYIILLDTLRNDFDKYILSLKKKEYAPAYVIRKDGIIHKFYDELYHSPITNIEKINKNSIFIALENSGKLLKEENKFINWCEEVINVKNVEEVINNKEFLFYEKYKNEQIESLAHLIVYLGNKYNLNLKQLNIKNREDNSIIFLKDIDVFSYSPNSSLNIERLNSLIFKD
jgi:N-acetyl-anhydromuramyl-L-alanine amidase AmpD